MTHSGVLATILSGLEPAVAIALSCTPLLRPLFKTRRNKTYMPQYYGSSASTKMFSKERTKRDKHLFDTLDDNSSEIQLQPFKAVHNVRVSATPDGRGKSPLTTTATNAITVDTRWEVGSD